MRITSQMAFNNLVGSVQQNLTAYTKTQQMITSNERIGLPSDDPTGLYVANNLNVQSSAVQQYLDNMTEAGDYLDTTDGMLQELNDLLAKARTLAEAQATETSTATTRQIAADEIQQLIGQALDIANTKVRDRYIFSGYRSDEPAYSDVGLILPAYANSTNTYTGTATSSGTYTGTENKSYLVRIVTAGAAGTAQYQVSEDNGTTWGSVTTLQNGDNAIYDNLNGTDSGVRLSFSGGTFGVGDQFRVEVAEGLYKGDNGLIDFNAGRSSRITTNVTGQEVFEDTGFFQALHKIRNAMLNDSTDEISQSVEDLKNVQEAMEPVTVKAGSRLTRIEVAKSSLTVMQENLASSLQNIEEPDSILALTQLAMQESALSSSTAMLAKILPENLFNYL